jgi:hypothetical protein
MMGLADYRLNTFEFATNLERLDRRYHLIPAGLFLLCLGILLLTMCPTVYGLDSAELATGAAILGIVHAPGYPLYVLGAHLFTLLPIGDVAFRVNLFSAVCLALTAPVLYNMLQTLVNDRLICIAATLTFIWSFYVWQSGTVAEIYAPQLLTLALCGWSLVSMYRDHQLAPGRSVLKGAVRTGILFGVAIATIPSSIFFAPGLAVCFFLMRVPLRISVIACLFSIIVVLSALLYFPIRGSAHPEFNKIGFYDSQGEFHNFDYRTPQGILRATSAEQFRYLFFMNGYVPNSVQLSLGLSWLARNYSVFGILLGVVGGVYLFRQRRGLFLGWMALALPYTYFYLCYGAIDRDTMFGPTYLALAVFIAFGLQRVSRVISASLRSAVLVGLPLLALVSNFSAVNLSGNYSTRAYAETVLQALPPNAVVAGYWADITPLQYLPFVENQRPDVKIYDLFMFKPNEFHLYLDKLSESEHIPIIVTNSAITAVFNTSYTIAPILAYVPGEYKLINLPILASFRISKAPHSSKDLSCRSC